MDQYQKFIAASRYARWLPEEGRRETWPETVKRYIDFWRERLPVIKQVDVEMELDFLQDAIEALEVMPSMRCLMTAGPALDRDNVAGFNCSYMPIDSPRAFDELAYILLCGTGVGFSVERQYVSQLPVIAEEFHDSETTIVVPDSKIGWAKALRQLIALLYTGEVPRWDVSKVRPAGAPLLTFGGRASGPNPLVELFEFTVRLFTSHAGKQLSSLDCHDLVCKIAEVIVVGGVRRAALISLSNLSDPRMREAKEGQYWIDNPQRSLANNSVAYTEKPDMSAFLHEMSSLFASKNGERGVFSREAAKEVAGASGRRDIDYDFGTNPCSEIILRPNQFCNLSEVVVRASDTIEDLCEKVRKATILGTFQATLTNFRYLRRIWQQNTEEEALLGVSLTGIMDHPVMAGQKGEAKLSDWLNQMRNTAIETNKIWAERLGINQATAITCVKPSGTVSQLVNSSSGIHPRFDKSYIRTVRADNKDPLAKYMVEAGFPYEVDIHKDSNLVFSFPILSPPNCVTNDDVSAIEQLNLWKIYQLHWCEHKPSVTVFYAEDEFPDVMAWLWKNFDLASGISFLPRSDHVYKQAPYQHATKAEVEDMAAVMPAFDWEAAAAYEQGHDTTIGSQELACASGNCELP